MLEKNLDETNLKNRIFLRKIGKIGKNNFGKMLEKNFDKKKFLKQFLIKKCYQKRIHTKKLEKKFGKNIFEKNKKIVFRKIEKNLDETNSKNRIFLPNFIFLQLYRITTFNLISRLLIKHYGIIQLRKQN